MGYPKHGHHLFAFLTCQELFLPRMLVLNECYGIQYSGYVWQIQRSEPRCSTRAWWHVDTSWGCQHFLTTSRYSFESRWKAWWSLLVNSVFVSWRSFYLHDIHYRDDFKDIFMALFPIVSKIHPDLADIEDYKRFLEACKTECSEHKTALCWYRSCGQKPNDDE